MQSKSKYKAAQRLEGSKCLEICAIFTSKQVNSGFIWMCTLLNPQKPIILYPRKSIPLGNMQSSQTVSMDLKSKIP